MKTKSRSEFAAVLRHEKAALRYSSAASARTKDGRASAGGSGVLRATSAASSAFVATLRGEAA